MTRGPAPGCGAGPPPRDRGPGSRARGSVPLRERRLRRFRAVRAAPPRPRPPTPSGICQGFGRNAAGSHGAGYQPPTPRPYFFRFEPRHRALSGYTRPPPPPPRRRKRVGRPADTPHSNVKLRRYGGTQLRPRLGVWKWAAGYRSSRTNVPTILGLELTREPDTHQPKTTLPCSCFRAMWVTPTARRT